MATTPTSADAHQIVVSGIDIAWQKEHGTCTFAQIPVAMLWVDTTLAGMMSGVQAMVGTERFNLALQCEGRKSVAADWQVISRHTDFREGFKAIAGVAAVGGWGRWELLTLDEEHKECRFRVFEGWESRYQKALGVCWGSGMLAGKLAGYCSRLFDTDCWAEQTTFSAQGDAYDEFFVRPSSRSIEMELEHLLAADEATRADMATALRKLEREIAERTRIETSLRESEERYRILVENNQDGILFIQDGRIVFANQKLAEIAGCPAEDLIGHTPTDLIAPEDRAMVRERYLSRIQGETIKGEYMCRALRADLRTPIFIHLKVSIIDHQGRPAVVATVRDITEQHEVEERLRAAYEKRHELEFIIDHSPAIAFLWKAESDWPVEYVSDSIRQFGYYPEEFSSGAVCYTDLIHPDDRERIAQEVTHYSSEQGREEFQQEYRIMTRTGEVCWIDDRTWIRRNARGDITHFQGIILDITERKRMEEAVQESEARHATIFNTVHDALFIHDQDGRLLDVNQPLLAMFRITRAEALRMDIIHDFTGPGNPVEKQPDIWRRVLAGEKITFEWNARRPKDGTCFPVEVWLQCLRLGNRDLILANVRDISERKRLEAQRLELERQLLQTQKLESLGVLAGGIAHDFNNLLMIMLGNLDITLMDLPADSHVRSRIEQAMQAARRATDLTRQMLAYAGKELFMVSRLELNTVVQENLGLFRAALPRGATLNLALTGEPTPIEADAGQVQQVIMNLVTNAAEAIGDGAGTIRISTGIQPLDEDILNRSRLDVKPHAGWLAYVEVSDTGCGMDERTLERLFEPFFTTKFMGRGLGMSAVLGIVRGHQGAILVDSTVGRGTTVRALFPASEIPSEARIAHAGESPVEQSGLSRTIMVADDEDEVRGMCAALLARLGFKVVTAADGQEALLLFRSHGEDVACVILDLNMPHLDGLGTFRAMKILRPDVPVILCSEYNDVEAAERFANEGLAGFIQKPYSLKELQDVIARILQA